MPTTLAPLLFLLATTAAAQEGGVESGLDWQVRSVPVAGDPQRLDIEFSSAIAPGWIVYAPDFAAPEFGPRPATLKLEQPTGVRAEGALQALQSRAGSSALPGGRLDYRYFAGQARLRQRVRLPADAGEVTGTLRGQACQEQTGLCTLFKHAFRIAR
ncbi:MAG: protein-disulfide reductase DsbD family protein [Pseudomonas sp.]